MNRYINAEKMMIEETEAYISAQAKVQDDITKKINEVVHKKIQMLLADAGEDIVRCKDCKNRHAVGKTRHSYYCFRISQSVDDYDWCCWAKERGEDQQ